MSHPRLRRIPTIRPAPDPSATTTAFCCSPQCALRCNASSAVPTACAANRDRNPASQTPQPTASSPTSAPRTRRAFLRRIALQVAAASLAIVADKNGPDYARAASTTEANETADASDRESGKSEPACSNCSGGGRVSCELCSGTGFWRAISGNDSRLKYKGVVCPECEGSGDIICPICLGTGEGNIRGLLRRRRVEPAPGRVLQSN